MSTQSVLALQSNGACVFAPGQVKGSESKAESEWEPEATSDL